MLDTKSKKGISPLSMSIKSKNFECFKYIADHLSGDFLNIEETFSIVVAEKSPLFICVSTGNLEALRYLYENSRGKVNFDSLRTSRGFSIFSYAVYCKQAPIVSFLALRI